MDLKKKLCIYMNTFRFKKDKYLHKFNLKHVSPTN